MRAKCLFSRKSASNVWWLSFSIQVGPESLVHSVIVKSRKDLGLSSSNTPTSSSSPTSPYSSNSTWGAASNFFKDSVSPNTCLKRYDVSRVSGLGIGSPLSATINSSAPPFYGNEERDSDIIDEIQIQNSQNTSNLHLPF